jgi:hypothetical protein
MRYPDARFDDDPPEMKHSGFGIASFIIAIAAGVLEFILIGVASVLEATTPGGLDEESPEAILLGLGMIGGLCAAMLGVGLGLAGIGQRRRNKVFAVLGLVSGIVVFVGVLSLIVIGMLMP